jgi:hypothetical protein
MNTNNHQVTIQKILNKAIINLKSSNSLPLKEDSCQVMEGVLKAAKLRIIHKILMKVMDILNHLITLDQLLKVRINL